MPARLFTLIGLLIVLAGPSPAENDFPPTDAWQAVQKSIQDNLPQTAIEQLDRIADQARQSGQTDDFLRAAVTAISLQKQIGERSDTKLLSDLRSLRENLPSDAPEAAEALLLSIRADWLLAYYRQHRYQIADRTAVASTPDDANLERWSLPTLVLQIDDAYRRALSHAATLHNTPLTDYADLLTKHENQPTAPTPTLYDFVIRRAISFTSSPDYDVAVPIPPRRLDPDSPAFWATEDFVRSPWLSNPTNGTHPLQIDGTTRTLALYQQWLAFRLSDTNNIDALVQTDLARFHYAAAQLPESTNRIVLVKSLRSLADRYIDHPSAATVLNRLARTLDDRVESHQIASRAVQRHPHSPGGRSAARWIDYLEAGEYSVQTDDVWMRGENRILVNHRNLDRLFFKLVRSPVDESAQVDREDKKHEIASRPSIANFTFDLPPTPNYQPTNTPILRDFDGPFGTYWLIASTKPDPTADSADTTYIRLTRSDLAVVCRADPNQPVVDGIVTNNRTGAPLSGVVIHSESQVRYDRWNKLPPVTTDKDGRFKIGDDTAGPRIRLTATTGNDQLRISNTWLSNRPSGPVNPQTRLVLLTDRAIYRPGQTLRFKGLLVSADPSAGDYHTVSDRAIHLTLRDLNHQVIASFDTVTSAMGSIHGSFDIPADVPLGSLRLTSNAEPFGQVTVSVEQYKRPQFEVTLTSPELATIGTPTTVSGNASSYNDFPVADADVRYRITRRNNYPSWCFWIPQSPPIEIASGQTKTDRDGNFQITFDTSRDQTRSDLPDAATLSYHYRVEADVTDPAGETRSDQTTVTASDTRLAIDLESPPATFTDQLTTWSITTATRAGTPIATTGRWTIHRLHRPPPIATSNRQELIFDSNPRSSVVDWTIGDIVAQGQWDTQPDGSSIITQMLDAGVYRLIATTTDNAGNRVLARIDTFVIDPDSKESGIDLPSILIPRKSKVSPGEDVVVYWSSQFGDARGYVEIVRDHQTLQSFWTPAGQTQTVIRQPVDLSMRGGLTVRVTMVHDNKLYEPTQVIDVPWTNKQLTVTAKHLRSRLTPGQSERVVLQVDGPEGADIVPSRTPEMVVTMYDASLDAIRPLHWPDLNVFRRESSFIGTSFSSNLVMRFGRSVPRPNSIHYAVPVFASAMTSPFRGHHGHYGEMAFGESAFATSGEVAMPRRRLGASSVADPFASTHETSPASSVADDATGDFAVERDRDADVSRLLASVDPRTNLGEIAFFEPTLRPSADGTATIEFTVPDSLTRWRIVALAHDTKLRSGVLDTQTITAKDLMVRPNPPRFLRSGDHIVWTTKISNRSTTHQTGTAKLQFFDAIKDDDISQQLIPDDLEQTFDLPAGGSTVLTWPVNIPDRTGPVVYRITAVSDNASDGQEDTLPILPQRMLVHDTLSMAVRGRQRSSFQFKPLLQVSTSEKPPQHKRLHLSVTSHPAWQALFALPYLMEYPHQCSEQIFARFYANSIARKIAIDNPKMRQAIDSWKASGAIKSPLRNHTTVRSIAMDQTPWLSAAQSETAMRQRLAGLFDTNRIESEIARAQRQLADMQNADGSFPWFPGGRGNDFITLTIATGLGRMASMNLDVEPSFAASVWAYLDAAAIGWQQSKDSKCDATVALYLYGRSFDRGLPRLNGKRKRVFSRWLDRAAEDWTDLPLVSQGHIALAMHRSGRRDVAEKIVQSLRERSVDDPGQGLHWPSLDRSTPHWSGSPIETQSVMIELLDEVADDPVAVHSAQIWLIAQKQTQSWPSTRATTDAVQAIVGRGDQHTSNSDLMKVTIAGEPIHPSRIELGTGAFAKTWFDNDITANLGNITLDQPSDSIGYASLHLSSLQSVDQIRSSEPSTLSIGKQLFIRRDTASGKQLIAISEAKVRIGDELVSRLTLATDRDLDFVRVHDLRGSGTEPSLELSGYDFTDGLWIYTSTRDTGTDYFIESLPKGTHVLENTTRVQLAGAYTTGYATAQCLYAPEIRAHSPTKLLTVH